MIYAEGRCAHCGMDGALLIGIQWIGMVGTNGVKRFQRVLILFDCAMVLVRPLWSK